MTRAPLGDLPIGTMIRLIGDTDYLSISGRQGDRVELKVSGMRVAHMTLDHRVEVEVVAVPSGYRHQWRPTK